MLGEFDLGVFFAEYWQRKHLFLPQALADFSSPLSADELAGLCCDPDVESRLITHTNLSKLEEGQSPWQLQDGPFNESDFSALGPESWTLLVQDVDKWVPEVAKKLALLSAFPRWSVDDIMVSYAAPGGSVGPHTDKYDVFLVQAQGTRRWQIANIDAEQTLRSDTHLKVLQSFVPEVTYEARPGDVLYLPPGVAHYGVAQDECLTYSFGFRAPTEMDLLGAFADEMLAAVTDEPLRESLRQAPLSPSEIAPGLGQNIRELIKKAILQGGRGQQWFGRYLTEPKPNIGIAHPENSLSVQEFLECLRRGYRLQRSMGHRFLFADSSSEVNDDGVVLFVDGESYSLNAFEHSRELALILCERQEFDHEILARWLASSSEQIIELLVSLFEGGALQIEAPPKNLITE